MKIIFNIFTSILVTAIFFIGSQSLNAETISSTDVPQKSYDSQYIHWDGKKGEDFAKGEIIYTDSGSKYLVINDFKTTGKNDLDSENVKQIIDYGVVTTTPSKSPRMETCAGDQWKTVKKGSSKTNIVNKYFGTVNRKTAWYGFTTGSQQTLSTSISGYGVTIKLDMGTSGNGSWGVTANQNKASQVRSNVKGNIQTKQSNSCTTMTRFVKTDEWATVRY